MKSYTRLILTILIFSIFSPVVCGRSFKGSVTDNNGNAVAYANIAIFNDSTFISAFAADSCGMFSTKIAEIKSPRLRVGMIGYETVDTVITGPADEIVIRLGDSSLALDEIEVIHSVPTVMMKGDVLVTDVSGSALRHLGSANDVLRHVPLISMGSEDQIEVFGRGTPAVYINGRKVSDQRELRQLKSENIKSIEVITNPGAKYSADVMSVVRIRTIRQRGEGLSTSLGLSETYDNRFSNSGDLTVRYRKNSLELFAEGSYSIGKHAYTTGNDQWSADKNGTLRQDAISDRVADMAWAAVKTGFSYDVSSNHSLGTFYNYSYWRKYESLDNIQDISVNGVATDRWLMNGTDTTISAPTHNVNLYYTGEIQKFTVDLNADFFDRDNTHNFFFNERNSTGTHNDIYINNSGHCRMFAEKLVLSYHFGDISVEAGEEFTHSRLTSDSRNTGAPFAGTATKVSERNIAPFAEAHGSWHNVKAGIDLRYENTINDFEEYGADERNRRVRYSRLFPSMSAAWSDGQTNISFSYTNKSVRPTYSQLSDILEYSTRTKYWRGNPELTSEIHHNFQISASWKNLFGQFMYSHIRDAIFQTYEPYAPDSDVSLITYRNIPTLNTVNLTLGYRHTIAFWTPAVTMSLAKQWHHLTTADGRRDLSSPIGRIRYDNTFNLPEGLQAMLSFDFTSGGDNHNHGYKSRHSLDASVSKPFLDGDVIVSAVATDLLDRSYLRYSIYNEIGQINCLDTWPSRSFRLSVRYSFNTASSRYKGRGAGAAEKSRL